MTVEPDPPLREVIARYGLAAKRGLGQHFLLDLNLTARVARAAGALAGCDVIEVGPGPGGLTRSLLASDAARVVAIEKDPRCVEALAELEARHRGRLVVVEGDALAIDPRALTGRPRKVVANLPYNVATPLLIGWLRTIADYDGLTLMFQREVAERICARPGAAAYGRLGVLAQWLAEVEFAFSVDSRAFTPPPKVASAVVTLVPRAQPVAPADVQAIEKVTAAAFGQRRKKLGNSLKAIGLDPAAAGVDPDLRPHVLDVPAFCALARAWRAANPIAASRGEATA